MTAPRLIDGLSEMAADYDALICDVWGVVHDGHAPHAEAVAALRRFRESRGPVVLLTNAPRTPDQVAEQFRRIGVSALCYDAIVSSGGVARDDLAVRTRGRTLPLCYVGPESDATVFAGLSVVRVGIEEAEVALVTGLRDDLSETPADYCDMLAEMRRRDLPMLCANPDLQVHRGPVLCWCAGALARDYEALGGKVVYYGKPRAAVYDVARAQARKVVGGAEKFLAIGDGLLTDIKGANAAGLDALFIADGVHGEEAELFGREHLAALFARTGVSAAAAARTLRW